MKAHAGAQDSHSTGQCQPAAAEHVGNAKSREDAAEDMQRTGGNAADEEKVKVFRTVFCQVADIFEGGEATAMAMAMPGSSFGSGSKMRK